MTLLAFLERFLALRVGVSKEWTAEVRRVTTRFCEMFGDLSLTELNENHLAEFWRRHPGRDRTKNNKVAIISALWREAYRLGYVDRLPRFCPKAKVSQSIPQAWTDQELKKVLEVIHNLLWQPVGGVPAWLWWKGLVMLIYYTGARLGSVIEIRKEDVDLANGWLVLRKTKNRREQLLKLPGEIMPIIEAMMQYPGEKLFPGNQSRQTICRRLRKIVERAGIPAPKFGGKQLSHRIRRTHLSYVFAVNPELAKLQAGHTSLKTTLQHYIDPKIAGLNQFKPEEVLPPIDDSEPKLRIIGQ